MLRTLTALVLAGTLALPAAAADSSAVDVAAVAWTVETVDGPNGSARSNFSYVTDPGATVSDTMRVVNTGATPLDLAVYAADAYTTPTGHIDLNTTDQPSTDAGSWVAIGETRLQLAPGAVADVPFTVTIPADAAPGDHAAGLITSFRGGSQSTTIDVDRRLATRINVRVSGELAPSVDVDAVTVGYEPSWNPFVPGVVRLSYEVSNTGNTLVTGTDASVATAPLGLFAVGATPEVLPGVIPGSTVVVERSIPIAPWGWVSGSVVVHPEAIGVGARGLGAVSIDYGVPAVPWTLLIVFVVIGVGVAIVLVIRRRRMSRPERQQV